MPSGRRPRRTGTPLGRAVGVLVLLLERVEAAALERVVATHPGVIVARKVVPVASCRSAGSRRCRQPGDRDDGIRPFVLGEQLGDGRGRTGTAGCWPVRRAPDRLLENWTENSFSLPRTNASVRRPRPLAGDVGLGRRNSGRAMLMKRPPGSSSSQVVCVATRDAPLGGRSQSSRATY